MLSDGSAGIIGFWLCHSFSAGLRSDANGPAGSWCWGQLKKKIKKNREAVCCEVMQRWVISVRRPPPRGGWTGRDQSDSLPMRTGELEGPAENTDVGRGPTRSAQAGRVRAVERLKRRVSERLIFHPSYSPSVVGSKQDCLKQIWLRRWSHADTRVPSCV